MKKLFRIDDSTNELLREYFPKGSEPTLIDKKSFNYERTNLIIGCEMS